MTKGSERASDVAEIIETLLELLCPERVFQDIEYPIDKTSAEFQATTDGTMTGTLFNKIIADFVKLIYGKALRFPSILSDREALAEAVYLLSNFTDAEGPDRYGAILSIVIAVGPEELNKILFQLAEAIKDAERRKYNRWVFTCHFQNLEWKKKCHIVSSYKESILQSIPEELQRLKPVQLVEYFEDLIGAEIMFRNIFNQKFNQEVQSS